MGRRSNEAEQAALVALLRERPHNLKWPEIAGLVNEHGSAVAVWDKEFPADLFSSSDEAPALAQARRDIAEWDADQLGFMTFLDNDYPAQLRDIHDFPPVLFHRGTLIPSDVGIAVVGSRAASTRGLELASAISTGLVKRGITVLAGLALGIDTAAHVAALKTGGRTVAIIGTGIRKYYPKENRELQDQIAAEGLVLSQFWPDGPPGRHTFPMRNTVMSGYGQATIVVEAGEYSGARIQARQAVAHGRPVILSDLVVKSTKWSQELRTRPGVHVATSADEALTFVDDILAGPTKLGELLAAATRA
ncbi:DNA-processing protein DprA [Pseudonocardia spinosispora]|uniref:DNA-processing protein DprA n=1 Tax=Pseudonocardia spinosispora TaxID=103441 RepID=UPI00048ACBFE|nr:DNA-processing protein DprA [Pseudonocardia spinosispora]